MSIRLLLRSEVGIEVLGTAARMIDDEHIVKSMPTSERGRNDDEE
jgi:hypothetical protein